MDNNEQSTPSTPPQLKQSAAKALGGLIPQKSQSQYLKAYQRYEEWSERQGAKKVNENVLLASFAELSQEKKRTTLWSEYSILKKISRVHQSIDIRAFMPVSDFIK